MKYFCESCGYGTNDKPNYNKHLKTTKHKQLADNKKTTNEKKNTINNIFNNIGFPNLK